MKMHLARLCALACLLLCGDSRPASAELIYGIATVGNATNVVTFDSDNPSDLLSGTFVTGLQPNEAILGIDVRPATRQLYALGSTSRLYTLDPATGAATAVGSPFAPALNGFGFGFDFNPVIDRIRVVSDADKNLVLNPDTGAVELVASDLHYIGAGAGTEPNVVHAAYSNNRPGALTTQLYGIDVSFGKLVAQLGNTGELSLVQGFQLFERHTLGGFDISGASGFGIAALIHWEESISRFYVIDLTNTTGFPLGGDVIGGGMVITAIAAAMVPEPSAATLFACWLLGGLFFRRRCH